MIRSKSSRAALALAFVMISSLVTAQTVRRVPTGEVSGVELQIDGRLSASHARPLRLALTTFEVLGLDRLRRAPNVRINVYASFRLDRPVATLTSDPQGRAFVEIPIPEDHDTGFSVVVEARTPSRVLRRFEFPVAYEPSRELSLGVAPNGVFPGSPIHVGGRLADRFDGRGIAGAEVVVDLVGPRGPVGGTVRLTTDETGAFRTSLTLATDAPLGGYTATARTAEPEPLRESASVDVVARSAPPMLVSVAASAPIAAPRATIGLEVSVRRPDGRPVEGALVRTVTSDTEAAEGRTDGRGRVSLRFRLRSTSPTDERVAVTVEKAGLGSAHGGAIVRVANARFAARVSFEGGRFASALGGRAYARVVTIDGRPAPEGVPVVFAGPRIRGGEVAASTDAFGVATAELGIGPSPRAEDEVSDACGGTVATEVRATVGEGAGNVVVTRCLLLDPDGVVRVRAASPRVARGGEVAVRVDRVAAVARAPVVIELIDLAAGHDERRGAILAARTLAGGASELAIPLPADVAGLVGIRARVLSGDGWLELRGATTAVQVGTTAPFEIDGRFDRERSTLRIDYRSEPGEPTLVTAIAMPYDRAVGLVAGFDPANQIALLPPRTADELARGESWLVAQLADLIPTDEIAAHAFVDGAITPRPGPDDPESAGRVRDPYRARARFVEGRLGLLFRALESFVDESVPGDEAEVMHVENGRFVLNDAVLSAVASDGQLGGEGATGLGGEPITISQLRAIDPSFEYDAVARRVTRVRLFKLLVSLRQFVTANGFDLAWARPGDPRVWVERTVEAGSGPADVRSLVDGWGRPFQLVPTSRPRFALVQPVVGFELVSAGPDGRFGNGDDVFDPTARVLPANSVYAQSVLEDALVARLRGVELSRATLSQVADLFGVYLSGAGDFETPESGGAISEPSPRFPSILPNDPEPLAVRRIGRTIPSVVLGPARRESGSLELPVSLGTEPRSWGIVVYAVTPSGELATTLVRATTGTGVLAHGELPARLSVGVPSTIELAMTNVGAAPRPLTLRAIGCDGLRVSLPAELALAPEVSAVLRAELVAARVGRCDARIEALDGDRVVASVARAIDVDSGAHPERRRVTELVGGAVRELDVAAPDGASRASGRLTITDTSSIVELPELAPAIRTMPALLAWSRVQTGRVFDDALRDAVLSVLADTSTTRSTLHLSLAAIALSSRVDDELARAARDRLVGQLDAFGNDAVAAADAASGHRRMASAVVAAFAITGAPDPDEESSSDRIARLFARLLPELRASVRAEVASPVELAFPAAALLLVDARDGHGRALFERVFAASTLRGGLRGLSAADGHEATEATIAEVAMAIAAHELGRHEDALAFARHALRRMPAIARSAEDGPFWLAALGVYGTLASESVAEVELAIDGRTERVRLDEGRVVRSIAIDAGDRARVRVRALGDALVVAEAEVAYERPFAAETSGPLAVAIAGDPGRAYGVGALELTITSTEAVFDPVVELVLPSSVDADEMLLRAIRGAPNVASVEARRAGFVRIALRPMQPGTITIPLPLSFQAVGRVTGLAVSAYPASDGYRRTVLPPRTFDLAE